MRGWYFKGVVHGKKKSGHLNDSPISEVYFQRFNQTMTIGFHPNTLAVYIYLKLFDAWVAWPS
jgi:hypothetical protein